MACLGVPGIVGVRIVVSGRGVAWIGLGWVVVYWLGLACMLWLGIAGYYIVVECVCVFAVVGWCCVVMHGIVWPCHAMSWLYLPRHSIRIDAVP